MARGRKPDLNAPSNVVFIDGAPATPKDEPKPQHYDKADELRPVNELTEQELVIYDDLAPYLVMLGRLKKHYLHSFCEYCRIYVRLAVARKDLDAQSWTYVIEGRNGEQIKMRPEVAQLNEMFRQFRSLVGEFGLAPAADRGLSNGQLDLFDDGFDRL
jgi:phage terminase small subunit